MKKTFCLLSILSTVTSLRIPSINIPPEDQLLECYDRPDCNGIQLPVGRSPIANLGHDPYNFDNRIQSCKYNGVYNLYDDKNYNKDNIQGAVYAEAWGDDLCINMGEFSNKATSIRLVGAPNGWRHDTINFYEGEYYNGLEQYFYGDSSSFQRENFGRSMIITGCSPWTIYELPMYKGQHACFYPADTKECYPSFFPTLETMNGWANQISSVRHGCFAQQILRGKPIQALKSSSQVLKGSHGKSYNI